MRIDSAVSVVEALSTSPLFAGVAPSELAQLGGVALSRTYGAGQQILAEDGSVLFIVHGCVRVYHSSAQGDEYTIETLRRGGIFGLSLLYGDAKPSNGLEATEAGTDVIAIPRQHLESWALGHPPALLRAVQLLGRQYEGLSERASELALYPVRQRLAREVLREVTVHGTIEISATQAQLAARIGSKRLEVARGVGELRDRHVVESKRGRRGLLVVDIEELAAIADDSE